MKTMNTAVTRAARSSARTYLRRCSSVGLSVLAAGALAAIAIAWGTPSRATPAPAASHAERSSSDVLALEADCELGDAVDCNDLGVTYLRGLGVPADEGLALRAFERACTLRSPDGCGNLGALYESGTGVPESASAAASLYEQACSMGCALGCSNLGALYARGRGVERDTERAQHLFTVACETGSAAGCSNLLPFSHARL